MGSLTLGTAHMEQVTPVIYSNLLHTLSSHLQCTSSVLTQLPWTQVFGSRLVCKAKPQLLLSADSEEDVRREIAFVFPDFSLEHWYQNEEPLYRNEDLTIRTKEHINHSINHTDHSQYNS